MARQRGLSEVLVTEALDAELRSLDPSLVARRSALENAEAPDRIGLHLGRLVEKVIAAGSERERAEKGVALARALISQLGDDAWLPERPLASAEVLRAIAGRRPDGEPETIPQPLIPLLDTTLLTNAPGEPRVGHQVAAEIHSAQGIDLVMAFIRQSGIAPMLESLRAHCAAGRPLRVLTTIYTGSTEARALEALSALGAQVRVSYDVTGTRLHAKAWMFHRPGGFSTAYIGSSNLTFSAQQSGLEWNVRVSQARNPDVLAKMQAVFDSYWSSGDFVPFEREEFEARSGGLSSERVVLLTPIELRPEPFQERLLELVALARAQGHHQNLLVSATGTGKTVMAALDYARLRTTLPRARLLFVAHREELLTQSRATFCHALREPTFGELWVGGKRPAHFEHVFASIQSLSANGLEHLTADHFDVVIVDEFHHAAAGSYRALLERVKPRELLGLTATPERADGLPILDWFGGRIAAELRLWDAVDQHRLVPFSYFGVHDGLDLRDVPWRRGHGYAVESLSGLYTGNHAWARLVLQELERRVDSIARIKALGFCVTVEHARFMAAAFTQAGVAATAIWADSPEKERKEALERLARGDLRVVFSVDLFNEGVDVPAVDTLLMLRPTESPTLFLQQLGRGLRRHPAKARCTVLDFIGHHRAEFRFDRRFRALLGGTRREVEAHIEAGFPFLPAGCHVELDRVASEVVLRSIRNALPTRWAEKVSELRALPPDTTLAQYLECTGLDVDDVYGGDHSWSELRAEAGHPVDSEGPDEASLRRACGRMLHVDDVERLGRYREWLARPNPPVLASLPERGRRLLRMLVASLQSKAAMKTLTLEAGITALWKHAAVRAELVELFEVLLGQVAHPPKPVVTHPEVPLQVHARYSRVEILAAFGIGTGAKVMPWQTGVYWAKEAKADLFAITLDKTSGGFSPTTRYRDYALSRDLFHWESQGATREKSPTGQRYQRHEAQGSSVMLFARPKEGDRAFFFLGPARYVSHQGELPMAITWRLDVSLPGDLYTAFAAAVA